MNKKLALAVLIVLFLVVGDAYGEMTGEEWMNSHNSPHATEKVKNQLGKYLAGVAHGIEIMDVMLEVKGHNIRFFVSLIN